MPASKSDNPYRIGRSKTGLGLFATQPIKKGSKIIRYIGPMLDCKKPKDDAVENKYLFQITKRWTVDGSVRKNVARYINHACKPNAESDVNTKKLKITIRAIKNIAPGDEINYDYGTEYFKEYLKPIGCKCDACEKKRAKKALAARADRKAAKAKTKAKAEREAKSAMSKSATAKSATGKDERSKGAARSKPSGTVRAAAKAKVARSKTARPKTASPKAVPAKSAAARAKSPAVGRSKAATGAQARAA